MKSFFFLTLLLAPLVHSMEETEFIFFGNDWFSNSELEQQLGLPEEFENIKNSRKDLILYQFSKTNIEYLYLNEGFFESRVELSDSLARNEDEIWKVYTFRIHEGQRYRFGAITLKYPPDAVNLVDISTLNTAENPVFRQEYIAEDLREIRRLYNRNGYIHVRIQHRETLDTAASRIHLEFSIHPGLQLKQGAFLVNSVRSRHPEGLVDNKGLTSTRYLRKLWGKEKGEVIDGEYLSEYRSKLLGTGLFSQIRVSDSIRNREAGQSDIHLDMVERIPGNTRLSAFYNINSQLGISAHSTHSNIGGTFNEGRLGGILAFRKQEVSMGYGSPLFLGSAVRFDDEVSFKHEFVPTAADTTIERSEIINRGAFTRRYPLMRLRGITDLRYRKEVGREVVKLSFEGVDIWNFTDFEAAPTRGFRIRHSLANGGGFRSTDRFWYSHVRTALYLPMGGPFFWAMALDGGLFFQKGNDDAQIFYQGGSRSVRGHKFQSIAPSRPSADTAVDLEYGRSPRFVRGSLELRANNPFFFLSKKFSWMRPFQLVQFWDMTRVWDADLSYRAARGVSAGLGLRYTFKVLTFRLDYALKKDFTHLLTLDPFSFGRINFDLSQAI